jgi:hypothetical protein
MQLNDSTHQIVTKKANTTGNNCNICAVRSWEAEID